MTDFAFPPRPDLAPPVPPPEERLTSAQAAAYLGVSVGTLRNWRHALTGPAYYRLDGIRY